MMGMHLLLWVHSERAAVGARLWANTSRRTPCRAACSATSSAGACPPAPLATRMGRATRRLGEHQVGARRPGRELQEFRRPRGTRAAGPDEVAVGRMGRVDHRPRRDHEPVGAVGADRRAQAVRGGQPAQLADELGALIGDQRFRRSGPKALDVSVARRDSVALGRGHSARQAPSGRNAKRMRKVSRPYVRDEALNALSRVRRRHDQDHSPWHADHRQPWDKSP